MHCGLHVGAALVAVGAALVLMRTHVFDPAVLQDIAKGAIANSNGTADGVIADVIRALQGLRKHEFVHEYCAADSGCLDGTRRSVCPGAAVPSAGISSLRFGQLGSTAFRAASAAPDAAAAARPLMFPSASPGSPYSHAYLTRL